MTVVIILHYVLSEYTVRNNIRSEDMDKIQIVKQFVVKIVWIISAMKSQRRNQKSWELFKRIPCPRGLIWGRGVLVASRDAGRNEEKWSRHDNALIAWHSATRCVSSRFTYILWFKSKSFQCPWMFFLTTLLGLE